MLDGESDLSEQGGQADHRTAGGGAIAVQSSPPCLAAPARWPGSLAAAAAWRVGYSSSDLTGSVLGALRQIAEQTRTLDDQRWEATKPLVVNQRNDLR